MRTGIDNLQHEDTVGLARSSTRVSPMPRRARVRRLGMTLIELTVIIAIIGLLLAIMLPSMFTMQKLARKASTQTTINTLASACEIFKSERNGYPDSAKATIDTISNTEGRHGLVYWLTGKSNKDANSLNSTGWRPGPRGKLYNADFFGITNVPIMTEQHDGLSFLSFQDSFGRPIYYYSWHGPYDDKDNESGGPFKQDPDFIKIQDYASDSVESDGTPKPVIKSFLLMSQGADEKWNGGAKNKGDDVTNFFR